ncbi:septum formation initiator family protein [Eubacterium sp.]|uniref:septum formation initiator family protein n=1 Tax=Eubacterium sp. TaxID=142586 RepID=UPI0025EC381C|nr:septum formation initiator family protein [Eubacterium sp.]MCR5629757.1 septum formation initiator family protein [Eubacterium sp.]
MATRRKRIDNRREDTAIARASKRRKKKRRSTSLYGLFLISAMALLIVVTLGINIRKSQKTLNELESKEAKLIEQKEEQLELREELEKRAVYVKTKAYVEEMAKKLGLVYPDEVIFKPEEEK